MTPEKPDIFSKHAKRLMVNQILDTRAELTITLTCDKKGYVIKIMRYGDEGDHFQVAAVHNYKTTRYRCLSKPRLCHTKVFKDKLSAIKFAASLVHRKIHREKKQYQIKAIQETAPDQEYVTHLQQMLDMKPCKVPFYVDKLSKSMLDFIDRLELE